MAYKTMRVLRSSIHVQRIIFLSVSHRISGARAVAFSNSPLPPPLHPPPDLLSGLQLGQWGSIKWAAGHRGGHSTLLLSSGRTRSQTAAEQQAGLDLSGSGSGPRLGAPAQLPFDRGPGASSAQASDINTSIMNAGDTPCGVMALSLFQISCLVYLQTLN